MVLKKTNQRLSPEKAYENYLNALNNKLAEKRCVKDGCVDYEKYNRANGELKILFLTKEPHDIETGNLFDDEEFFGKEQYEAGEGFRTHRFWKKIFLSAMAINSGLLGKTDISLSLPEKYEDIKAYIYKTAVVNVKKIDDRKSISSDVEIYNYASKYKTELRNQINSYSPDVIVCGGTIESFEEIFQVNNKEGWLEEHGPKDLKKYPFDLKFLGDSNFYWYGILKENKKYYIVINYYHPSVYQFTDGLYILGINNISKIARNYIRYNYRDLFKKLIHR